MRRMNSSDGIRSLEIDFDKEILKINGQEVKERIVIVSLPGPEGYKYHHLSAFQPHIIPYQVITGNYNNHGIKITS